MAAAAGKNQNIKGAPDHFPSYRAIFATGGQKQPVGMLARRPPVYEKLTFSLHCIFG
jgi:hypothetical protein